MLLPSPRLRDVNIDCSCDWGTLQAHPLRSEKDVRVQFGGRPIFVGSKFTGKIYELEGIPMDEELNINGSKNIGIF